MNDSPLLASYYLFPFALFPSFLNILLGVFFGGMRMIFCRDLFSLIESLTYNVLSFSRHVPPSLYVKHHGIGSHAFIFPQFQTSFNLSISFFLLTVPGLFNSNRVPFPTLARLLSPAPFCHYCRSVLIIPNFSFVFSSSRPEEVCSIPCPFFFFISSF